MTHQSLVHSFSGQMRTSLQNITTEMGTNYLKRQRWKMSHRKTILLLINFIAFLTSLRSNEWCNIMHTTWSYSHTWQYLVKRCSQHWHSRNSPCCIITISTNNPYLRGKNLTPYISYISFGIEKENKKRCNQTTDWTVNMTVSKILKAFKECHLSNYNSSIEL